ncbi:MAG: hypothetical protein HOQ09_09530, partial [Gemmatimonadaceae bacterium]|nr:hypothetical protein [Gemmatimonadaceae bacterium]
RSDGHRRAAFEALRPLIAPASAPAATESAGKGASLSADDATAITRCVMAWLPMVAPNSAGPYSRCVAAARELFPTWGERERARDAVRRLHG